MQFPTFGKKTKFFNKKFFFNRYIGISVFKKKLKTQKRSQKFPKKHYKPHYYERASKQQVILFSLNVAHDQ